MRYRPEQLDLSGQIAELREQAGGLPHGALARAAREHAEYLDQFGRATDLLRRQVLLILREPLLTGGPARSPGDLEADLVEQTLGTVEQGASRAGG